MALKYLQSLISINVNGLNSPIKRHRVGRWIRKHNPTICCLQETHLTQQDKHRLKVKGWKTIIQANGPQKRAGTAILISDMIDFKIHKIKKDRNGHYLMLRGSVNQEDLTIINIYAPNEKPSKYIKRLLKELQQYINSNTIIVGDFNTPLSQLDRSSRKKISKDIRELNEEIDKLELLDISRVIHPKKL